MTAVAIWLRSLWFNDAIWYSRLGVCWGIDTLPGRISLTRIVGPNQSWPMGVFRRASRYSAVHRAPVFQWGQLGFGYIAPHAIPVGFVGQNIFVPFWILVVALGIAPAQKTLMRYRRWSRVSRGICPCCKYDLRATPDRCPECGTPTGTKTTDVAAVQGTSESAKISN
jgi:hypothetical protein